MSASSPGRIWPPVVTIGSGTKAPAQSSRRALRERSALRQTLATMVGQPAGRLWHRVAAIVTVLPSVVLAGDVTPARARQRLVRDDAERLGRVGPLRGNCAEVLPVVSRPNASASCCRAMARACPRPAGSRRSTPPPARGLTDMPLTSQQRQQAETRIRAADQLLRGDLPPAADVTSRPLRPSPGSPAPPSTAPTPTSKTTSGSASPGHEPQARSPTRATPRSPASNRKSGNSGSALPAAMPSSPNSPNSRPARSPSSPPGTTSSSRPRPRAPATSAFCQPGQQDPAPLEPAMPQRDPRHRPGRASATPATHAISALRLVPAKQLVDRFRASLHRPGGRREADASRPTADQPPLPGRRPIPGQHVAHSRMAPPPGSRSRDRIHSRSYAVPDPIHPASRLSTDPPASHDPPNTTTMRTDADDRPSPARRQAQGRQSLPGKGRQDRVSRARFRVLARYHRPDPQARDHHGA